MIKKEIVVRAPRETVWNYITDKNHLSEIWNSGIDVNLEKKSDSPVVVRNHFSIKRCIPCKMLSLAGGYGSLPVVTSYNLISKNSNTVLKITVCGWDKISQREAQNRLPAVSLDWEKRLMSIKKAIESATTLRQELPPQSRGLETL